MQAILVRIGIDHAYGQWNAPADPATGEFVYVPIPEKSGIAFHQGCECYYTDLEHNLMQFAASVNCDLFKHLKCPRNLFDQPMHLDPDFVHLTYGDVGDKRGSHIRQLAENDLLVFYAGLRPCRPCNHKLIYALVGLYVVDDVARVSQISKDRWHENAHTRKVKRGATDIVVRAKPDISGRLQRFIEIGEYRDGAYRVRHDLLKTWGGLSVKNGYLQRSARPPRFLQPEKFLSWFHRQNAHLLRVNNPNATYEADATFTDRVVIVHLRQPKRHDPNEMRSDPFWEFGSFGCTGCHAANLMNPRRIDELEGVRLAFAQGGRLGFRLVMLTPPVQVVHHRQRCELRWTPARMPARYEAAPLLVDNHGHSDIPSIRELLDDMNRPTWEGRFSSGFRSRREPLPHKAAVELCRVYETFRRNAPASLIADRYEQALPYQPNVIDRHRRRTYNNLRTKIEKQRGKTCGRKC